MKHGCIIEDCYFAKAGDQHEPGACVAEAEVEAAAAGIPTTAKCAGCGVELGEHAEANHRWFERWGEQDETWEASLN